MCKDSRGQRWKQSFFLVRSGLVTQVPECKEAPQLSIRARKSLFCKIFPTRLHSVTPKHIKWKKGFFSVRWGLVTEGPEVQRRTWTFNQGKEEPLFPTRLHLMSHWLQNMFNEMEMSELSWKRHRTGCSWLPVRILPYCQLSLHSRSIVVCHT